ncbi:MAG: hypothetical protein JO043_09175 [Candidatus Eremiobacteraeota bacterium]|nr:hypothetical protein [Candidatus Eremiobacteraeota bacterium]
MLDADERIDAGLREAIGRIPGDSAVDGYRVRRVTYFCGKAIRGAGWGEERLLRLFRTGTADVESRPAGGGDAELHERWIVSGLIRDLPGKLDHHSYPTVSAYRKKFAQYTALEAASLRITAWRVAGRILRVPLQFAWLFFVRGGWQDGWRGAFVCAGSALYPAVVAIKARRQR